MRPLRAGISAILVLCSATACGEPDYTTATVRWGTVQAVPGGVAVDFGGGVKGLPRDNPCWGRYQAAALSQTASRVVIGVWETRHAEYGPCALFGVGYIRRIPLDAPLGNRVVIRAPKDAPSPFDAG